MLYNIFMPKQKGFETDLSLFTHPKHGSWPIMAEIELQVLNKQCLKQHIATIEEVKEQVDAWGTHRDNSKSKINWQFTTKDARIN